MFKEEQQKWYPKSKSYSDRLETIKLPTLAYRRLRGDMVETYKITHNKYDPDVTPKLEITENNITRGHNYKLKKNRQNTRFGQHYFSNRII